MNRLERNEKATQMKELLRSLAVPLLGVVRTVAEWRRVARQRRALLDMDERQLTDIGVSRGQALQEAHRPFWDVPTRQGVPQPASLSTRRDRGAPRSAVAGRAPRWA